MTEPTQWAMERALDAIEFDCYGHVVTKKIALALHAAYRTGIEEAAKAAEARIPEKSEHQAEEIARDIRALAAPQSGGEG